jgi:hypothetical protein
VIRNALGEEGHIGSLFPPDILCSLWINAGQFAILLDAVPSVPTLSELELRL